MAAATSRVELPRHDHDCNACTFLGTYGESDLYHCPQHGQPTLIERHGKGPEYTSQPAEIVSRVIHEGSYSGYLLPKSLLEAYRRALLRRLPLG